MRDDNYLQGRLDYLWDRYFSDIEQKNDVVIRFGRKARGRLGSIKQEIRKLQNPNTKLQIKSKLLNSKTQNPLTQRAQTPIHPTIITINGLFKDEAVPEFLIDSVIAHEMVHYAHGFASPHEKKYDTPHAGGVIKKEMAERGLEDLLVLQKKWLKESWRGFVTEKLPRKAVISRRRKRRRFILLRKTN